MIREELDLALHTKLKETLGFLTSATIIKVDVLLENRQFATSFSKSECMKVRPENDIRRLPGLATRQ